MMWKIATAVPAVAVRRDDLTARVQATLGQLTT